MKKHYWMAGCELAFRDSEGETGIHRNNALVTTDEPYCTMKDLGKIQQGAQINLFNTIGERVEVANVAIISVSNLGHMTEEEFNNGAITQVANDG